MPDIHSALHDIAEGRREDPLAPVTVIVPSHLAGLQLRRRLAEIGPFAGVRFEMLPRIAELLGAGQLAKAGRTPLARPIGDYLAHEVARESRGILAQVGDLPGYARVLNQLFRRLRRGGILRASDIEPGERGGHLDEVLRLYDLYRESTAHFYDDEDLLEAAAAAVRARLDVAAAELGAIYVVPPGRQSAGSAAFLDALRDAAPAYVELDEAVAEPEVRFVLAPDPASEAREVVREVIGALENGASFHEIAVFHGAGSQYPRLLREAFEIAGVPDVYMPGVSLTETPAGRGAVALASLPEQDFSRTAVMDFLSLAPLRHRLPARDGSVQALSSLWDRLSRDAGITHGIERWRSGLAAYVADKQERLDSPLETEDDARLRSLRFELDHASDLKDALEALAARLEPLQENQPAASFVEAFKGVVEEYFSPDARALEAVVHEIDQLGTVDAVGGTFNLQTFSESLRANLDAAKTRERPLGEGVLVTDYRAAAGLRFERVILCGAYQGAFPPGPGTDALVADSAWARLRERYPYLEDAALRLERAREAAGRAQAAAGDGALIWSAPLNEPGGTREYYPSHFMVEAAGKKDTAIDTASKLRARSSQDGWLRRGQSPLSLRLAGPSLDSSELGLREAISLRKRDLDVPAEHERSRAVTMLRGRRGDRFTEWDGNLAVLDDRAWLELQSAVSPTSLEHYAACGFRYLCRSLLRLNTVEEPEERELMDPAAKGSLIHGVLESFFTEQQRQGRPAPGEAWTDDDLDALVALMEKQLEQAKRRGLTGLDIYAGHEARTLRADLAEFLEKDNEFRRATGAVPSEFEVKIPEATVSGVRLRGIVDRIDRSPDGKSAWVIDYKSGSKEEYEKIEKEKEDPLVGGTKLQLPTYLQAADDAEDVRAAYWFISRRGDFSFVEYEPTPERDRLFEDTLGAIVAGIREGAFPAVPGDVNEFAGGHANCRYCDFDRICSRRRGDEHVDKLGGGEMMPWARVAATARGGSQI